MSRYYGHVLITFTDGKVDRVGGNRAEIRDEQVVVYTAGNYGTNTDFRHFPLVNIREWHWEES